jgi:hypothetical protein
LYNATALDAKDILNQSWETICAQFDVNVGGAFTLGKIVLPFCLKENKNFLYGRRACIRRRSSTYFSECRKSRIAEQYWKLFNQKPGKFEREIIY